MLPANLSLTFGHAIGGVAGVYNRHSYDNEKADALKALASMIASIVDPALKTNIRAVTSGANRLRRLSDLPDVHISAILAVVLSDVV